MTEGQIEYIAEECHEINRAYCEILKDKSQVEWKRAPEWQKKSAIDGVRFVLSSSNIGPRDSHENWKRQKEKDGWIYGEVKNEENKTHPCLIPYDQLPETQRVKDHLFISVVRASSRMMSEK